MNYKINLNSKPKRNLTIDKTFFNKEEKTTTPCIDPSTNTLTQFLLLSRNYYRTREMAEISEKFISILKLKVFCEVGHRSSHL